MSRRRRQKAIRRNRNIDSVESLESVVVNFAHPLSWYRRGVTILVADKMQTRYSYTLDENPGENFDPDFNPEVSPAEMLRMGVFEGKYLNDCSLEFPREWFIDAINAGTLSPGSPNSEINLFKVKSRKSRGYWIRKGWIPVTEGDRDIRGWFQWYCRYWLGRRDENVDKIQIRRWRSFRRHAGQIMASYRKIKKNLTRRDKFLHRPRQRQALLQWAYNPFI